MECLQFDWKQNQMKLSFITLYLYSDAIVILLVMAHSYFTLFDRIYHVGFGTEKSLKQKSASLKKERGYISALWEWLHRGNSTFAQCVLSRWSYKMLSFNIFVLMVWSLHVLVFGAFEYRFFSFTENKTGIYTKSLTSPLRLM